MIQCNQSTTHACHTVNAMTLVCGSSRDFLRRGKGWGVLSACTQSKQQVALDSDVHLGGRGHNSLFSSALLDGLRDGEADTGKKGYVTGSDMNCYLKKRLKGFHNQHANLHSQAALHHQHTITIPTRKSCTITVPSLYQYANLHSQACTNTQSLTHTPDAHYLTPLFDTSRYHHDRTPVMCGSLCWYYAHQLTPPFDTSSPPNVSGRRPSANHRVPQSFTWQE